MPQLIRHATPAPPRCGGEVARASCATRLMAAAATTRAPPPPPLPHAASRSSLPLLLQGRPASHGTQAAAAAAQELAPAEAAGAHRWCALLPHVVCLLLLRRRPAPPPTTALTLSLATPCHAAGGSSLDTRKAAAAQIAGIAAAHPAQLPAVVVAVAAHLRHPAWDARVAAGHCLGLLAERFAHHTAEDLRAAAAAAAAAGEAGEAAGAAAAKQEGVKQEAGADSSAAPSAGGAGEQQLHLLSFSSFSVDRVLAQGTPMLASGGEVRCSRAAEPGRLGWACLRAGCLTVRCCRLSHTLLLAAPPPPPHRSSLPPPSLLRSTSCRRARRA